MIMSQESNISQNFLSKIKRIIVKSKDKSEIKESRNDPFKFVKNTDACNNQPCYRNMFK